MTVPALALQPAEPELQSPSAKLHVAIIMDGNGRWALRRGLPRRLGHHYGAEAAQRITSAAPGAGITHLTLFGFSTENWRRPWPEVECLMGVLRSYLQDRVERLHENGVRFMVIGDLTRFPPDVVAGLRHAMALTADNTGLVLTLALSYGGRADIVAAARHLAQQSLSGALNPDSIDEEVLLGALPTGSLPDVDLLIRTSGEQRVSNFLLWQLAYAELVFVDRHWPDFTELDLANALAEFRQRHRRFGGT